MASEGPRLHVRFLPPPSPYVPCSLADGVGKHDCWLVDDVAVVMWYAEGAQMVRVVGLSLHAEAVQDQRLSSRPEGKSLQQQAQPPVLWAPCP